LALGQTFDLKRSDRFGLKSEPCPSFPAMLFQVHRKMKEEVLALTKCFKDVQKVAEISDFHK
jgi:hypothetical protein